ncbi:type II secretion system PilB [Methylophilales bacterium MBRSG12]|uniref:Type II secretion system PilB n=1 Tax=Methylophilales bacterium MBRS-H7 TaxID=1623450 RepID=A0A0H4IZB7_9PROT|nr:type II secretion system PilB [Methylophilales bacterium MBRSF5]AKO65839.1 type II secretion system PilB [Methylophilales bacterium MBRS-H7]AKO67159.1 type II secretion system PilB [Methylophilales bacterium MBRSG12]
MLVNYSPTTSEKAIKAIINAGRLEESKINSDFFSKLEWNEKLKMLINDGSIDESWLVNTFAKSVSLTRTFPSPEECQSEAVRSINSSTIIENILLPYKIEDDVLHVLILDPKNISLSSSIKTQSSLNVVFEITSLSHFEKMLTYPAVSDVFLAAESQARAPKKKVVEKKQDEAPRVIQKTKLNIPKGMRYRDNFPLGNPDMVIDFCDQILNESVISGTSDIHIECFRDYAQVRMRRDGSMQVIEEYSKYLFKHYAGVITRFKILADCDISERRLPQDGAITIKDPMGGKDDIDFRFNIMPTKNGERIVMRILAGNPALSLDKLGFDPDDYNKIIDAINAPQGMVLVTGPTGSGKTTTLYGALQEINKPDTCILTAEDPVEYYLEGAGQVQANEKIGLTFSSILRAFLRQDPEVILVGEIRDQETIDIAIKAALTGHLLLSTLHTNDAIATITRIQNMGVPNFMIASALSVVVAQRLARKSCQECLEDDPRATPEELVKMGFKESELESFTAQRGKGCKVCGGSGLKGRQGIYEVLRMTKEMEIAILNNKSVEEIEKAAKTDGFRTMQEIGRDFVKTGILSIEEYANTLQLEN